MKKKETRGERENGRWRLTGKLDKGSLTILTCISAGVYIYICWYDIPELVIPIRISLIEGCC
jgi:hypothetical protein